MTKQPRDNGNDTPEMKCVKLTLSASRERLAAAQSAFGEATKHSDANAIRAARIELSKARDGEKAAKKSLLRLRVDYLTLRVSVAGEYCEMLKMDLQRSQRELEVSNGI